MKVEAFIIHLKRATARAPQVERLKRSLPMPVTVLDAVDGQALSEDEIAAVYRPKLHRPHYPFALRTSEVACFLSHRKAWQIIVERGLDAGLVVEDDVELDRDASEAVLTLALAEAQREDFIRFPCRRHRECGRVVSRSEHASLIRPRPPGLGTVMQIVGKDMAQALLETTRTFDRPVDVVLQMDWLYGGRVLSAYPVIAREMSAGLGGTMAQGRKTSFMERVRHEFLRPLYRLSIRLHALTRR